MADFSAKDVQRLRQETGAGMMDAKKALTQADGDFDAARQWLREQGLAKASGRTDRANEQGAVALAAEGSTAVLVELKAETDFSAKADDFVALAHELASAVLADGESAVAAFQDQVDTLKITKKENIELGRVVRFEVAEGNVLDSYVHEQDGRGVNGVLVEARGIDDGLAHEVALHIAFAKPSYLHRDEVPADLVERERAALLEITKAEGKPEAAWDKIVDGRVNAWFKERVLLEQGMFGEKESVATRLGSGEIVRYALVAIGS